MDMHPIFGVRLLFWKNNDEYGQFCLLLKYFGTKILFIDLVFGMLNKRKPLLLFHAKKHLKL